MTFAGRLVNEFYHFIWTGIDLLFPPDCAGCGSSNTRWCIDCNRKCRKINSPYCHICGRSGDFIEACGDCARTPPVYSGLRSWAIYADEIRTAIHRLKYNNDMALGEVFSRYLVRLLIKLNWQVGMVMPVPLSRERTKQRGYNQSALLARPLAAQLNLNYVKNGLFRVRDNECPVIN